MNKSKYDAPLRRTPDQIIEDGYASAVKSNGSHNVLTMDELTERFYELKVERNRLVGFCKVVCPCDNPLSAPWDSELGESFVKLKEADRHNLLILLDEAASYCPVELQDRIRKAVSQPRRGQ